MQIRQSRNAPECLTNSFLNGSLKTKKDFSKSLAFLKISRQAQLPYSNNRLGNLNFGRSINLTFAAERHESLTIGLLVIFITFRQYHHSDGRQEKK